MPEETENRPGKRRWLAILVPIALALAGVLVALYFVRTQEAPEREDRPAPGALVEVQEVRTRPIRSDVTGQGTVTAERVLEVAPEVGGRLAWVNPDLTPGGILRAGEPLFRIEARAYELAVQQQKSALAQARTELRLEQSRGRVAQRELELFEEDFELSSEADPSLVTREPQRQAARVAVESARAALERARLDLARTEFKAPWDAYVRQETADVGDLVSPQQPLATLVGIDSFWVEVTVPTDRIGDIAVPGINAEEGSPASIIHEIGDRQVTRDGRVVRLLGDLEERGRMARVLVRIEDPFGAAVADEGGQKNDEGAGDAEYSDEPPLLAGSYVTVEMQGRRTVPLVEVPREAVRGRDQVWVRTDAGTLAIREVEIAQRSEDAVFVSAGLEAGEEVVVTPIARPVEGMRLRLTGEEVRHARAGDEDG